MNPSKLNYFKKLFVKYPESDFEYHIFHYKLKHRPDIKLRLEEHKNFKWVTPSEALNFNLIEDEDECIKLFFNI